MRLWKLTAGEKLSSPSSVREVEVELGHALGRGLVEVLEAGDPERVLAVGARR